MTGSYNYKDKKYFCTSSDTIMLLDVGRGHHKFGIYYYWVAFQTILKDGRKFGICLRDGLGNDYHSLDKPTQDFAILDHMLFKLDISVAEYDTGDYMKPHRFKTAVGGFYPEHSCDITFVPVGVSSGGC